MAFVTNHPIKMNNSEIQQLMELAGSASSKLHRAIEMAERIGNEVFGTRPEEVALSQGEAPPMHNSLAGQLHELHRLAERINSALDRFGG